MAMEGGGTLSEIYHSSKKLLLRTRDGLERLERLEFSSPIGIDSPELSFTIKRDISQIQSLCAEMDRLWRSIASKPQRDIWKRKVEQVAEEVDSLKESLDKHLLRNQKRMVEAKERAELLERAEKHSELDFVCRNIGNVEPVRPLPIESTPLRIVKEVKELQELAAKLKDVNEFAVDLEHNHYRSFQGLTCLMQISTRTEDFVVDTLKLRAHIGPYLREIFKDPFKKKVMHGADRDIMWLQRDFGIYVCNMFDTGQASRVLQLERNSLEYLLRHFCGVTVNKEYQNSDWRLRPLPDEMLKYAREDTHYLLYIYDLMRARLLSASMGSEHSDVLLLEVYKQSYKICKQLYEKELWTDTSYLNIYGLQEANFDSKQLSIAAGLHKWRDNVARVNDESTGYVLPNKVLIEIARQMPLTVGKLSRLVKSKHPYVERNLGVVVSIIRSSILNAAAFEGVAQQIKEGCAKKVRHM